jgi:hypothetical protein
MSELREKIADVLREFRGKCDVPTPIAPWIDRIEALLPEERKPVGWNGVYGCGHISREPEKSNLNKWCPWEC